jgi:hypothetical protein
MKDNEMDLKMVDSLVGLLVMKMDMPSVDMLVDSKEVLKVEKMGYQQAD